MKCAVENSAYTLTDFYEKCTTAVDTIKFQSAADKYLQLVTVWEERGEEGAHSARKSGVRVDEQIRRINGQDNRVVVAVHYGVGPPLNAPTA
ncbi:MAG: hypothetical protein QW434_02675 [Pyrobaculum sp.]